MTADLRVERGGSVGVSPGKLARLLSVSPATVLGWASAGCPRHPDGTFRVPEVVAWRIARAAAHAGIHARLLRVFEEALRIELPKFEPAMVAARTPEDARRLSREIHAAVMRPVEAEAARMREERQHAESRQVLASDGTSNAAPAPLGDAR